MWAYVTQVYLRVRTPWRTASGFTEGCIRLKMGVVGVFIAQNQRIIVPVCPLGAGDTVIAELS